MDPRVSIVILNWNGWKDTIECLESLYQITYPNYDVIVVDNRSTDRSVEKIREFVTKNMNLKVFELDEHDAFQGNFESEIYESLDVDRRMILIKNRDNYGYAKGNNVGIKFALKNLNAHYVLILNNDCLIIDKSFLNQMVSIAEKEENVGIVGPKVVSSNGEVQRACIRRIPSFKDLLFVYSFIGDRVLRENRYWKNHFYYEYKFDNIKEVDIISGSCMLIKRKVFEKIGLLDENTFLYWEEAILGIKAKRNKIKTVVVPVEVIHKGGETVKNLNLLSFSRYHNRVSEVYFIEKYLKLKCHEKISLYFVLILEAILALIFSFIDKKYKKYYEVKIINFLLRKIFQILFNSF